MVQNVKDKGHLAYILKHELMMALILYKPNFADRAGLENQQANPNESSEEQDINYNMNRRMNKSAVLPENILDLLELPQDNSIKRKKTNRHSQNVDEFLLCEENKDESVHSKELETALYLDQ